MGVGETGQIIGETGVGETGVGEMGVNRHGNRVPKCKGMQVSQRIYSCAGVSTNGRSSETSVVSDRH